MKIKTADLTRRQLNWAMAKCEGFTEFEFWHTGAVTTRQPNGIQVHHRYADDWSQGGPIIERDIVEYHRETDGSCWAATDTRGDRGPSLLIAGLRAVVGAKLGHEVDVPQELCA